MNPEALDAIVGPQYRSKAQNETVGLYNLNCPQGAAR